MGLVEKFMLKSGGYREYGWRQDAYGEEDDGGRNMKL
jgi:hypothetical protein